MIRINLLGDDTVIDPSGLWIVLCSFFSLAALILACVLIHMSTVSSINALEPDIASLERQLNDIRSTTKEVRELDSKRAELKQKTEIIAVLKKSKRGPVRILDDLNNAIPDKCWVESAIEEDGLFKVTGWSLEDQSIADFISALKNSNFYSNVELKKSEQVDKGGFKLKRFTFNANVHYAGRTTELAASPSPTPEVEVQKRR